MGNDATKATNTANTTDRHNVFISYNMIDAQMIVNTLYLMFDKSQGNIFLAEKRALNATWKEFFRNGIDSADVVLIFFTNRYYTTKYTKIEFDDFVKQGKKMFIWVDAINKHRVPDTAKKSKNVTIIESPCLLELVNANIFFCEAGRIGAGQSGYSQLAEISVDAFATFVKDIFSPKILRKISPAFHRANELAKDYLQKHVRTPIILIDKEELEQVDEGKSVWDSLDMKLEKLAFIIPNGNNKYLIKGPENISQCTLVHINEKYLSLVKLMEEPISFEGTLIELLEKYKTNDDVQIFFFSEVQGNGEEIDSDTSYFIKSVLGTLLHTYNKIC